MFEKEGREKGSVVGESGGTETAGSCCPSMEFQAGVGGPEASNLHIRERVGEDPPVGSEGLPR